MKKYLYLVIGVFLGIGLCTGIYVKAQTQLDTKDMALKEVNHLFDPISLEKEALGITQQQSDMSYMYGRLDYISLQIKQLQDNICAK